ncbi:MAG: hypothetical protein HOF70_13880 [Rhodospirillaceae bacterium]|nr:hypothetical protein [Rhodospirillaceae bacterium]MBT4717828.1 hypothetical protein [Rhodospirillaceae bacterium]
MSGYGGNSAPASGSSADMQSILRSKYFWPVTGAPVLFLLLILALPFFWSAVFNPYIDGPDIQGAKGIDAIRIALDGLDARYKDAIVSQRSFKNVYSLIALAVGSAAAVAALLRAPQILTVSLSAFGGVIFGIQALFYSQPVVDLMAEGRQRLACVRNGSHILVGFDEAATNVSKIRSGFRNNIPIIDKSQMKLVIQVAHVQVLRGDPERLANTAFAKIQNELAEDAPDFISIKRDLEFRLRRIKNSGVKLKALPENEKHLVPGNLPAQLVDIASKLRSAIDALTKPGKLRNVVSDIGRDFVPATENFEVSLKEAERLTSKSVRISKDAQILNARLANFDVKQEQALGFIGGAITYIHSDILQRIARNELSPKAAEAIISQIRSRITAAASGQTRSLASVARSSSPNYKRGARRRDQPSPRPPIKILIDEAQKEFVAAGIALKNAAPDFSDAVRKSEQLERLIITEGKILKIRTYKMAKAARILAQTIDRLENAQISVAEEIESAKAIFERFGADKIDAALKPCLKGIASPGDRVGTVGELIKRMT